MLSPETNKIPFTFPFFTSVTSNNIWKGNEKKKQKRKKKQAQ